MPLNDFIHERQSRWSRNGPPISAVISVTIVAVSIYGFKNLIEHQEDNSLCWTFFFSIFPSFFYSPCYQTLGMILNAQNCVIKTSVVMSAPIRKEQGHFGGASF
jgi:hypothetical protein